MKPHPHKALIAAAVCLAPVAQTAAAVLDNDFSSDTLGQQPASMDIVTPTANTANVSATVINSTVLDGNALRLFDNEGTTIPEGRNISVRQATSAPLEAGIFSLDFTAGPNVGSTGNSFFRIALGTTSINAASSSTGSVFQRVVIASPNSSSTGTIAASNQGGGFLSDTSLGTFDESAANNLQVVFNNSGAAINYSLAGSQSVADNRYDVFLNGSLIADDFQMRTSSGDVTAIGFGTGGSQTGPDWIVDNLRVTAIPEPSSMLLAALGSLAMLGRRRHA